METFSALLAMCAGNSPVPGEFPAHRPVTRSFDVLFDLCLNKRLSKPQRQFSKTDIEVCIYFLDYILQKNIVWNYLSTP